jgi:hypothetical protein
MASEFRDQTSNFRDLFQTSIVHRLVLSFCGQTARSLPDPPVRPGHARPLDGRNEQVGADGDLTMFDSQPVALCCEHCILGAAHDANSAGSRIR